MRKLFGFVVGAIVAFCVNIAHAALPNGYTELEYIESTGTQYINTGFVPSSDFKHTLVFQLMSADNTHTICVGLVVRRPLDVVEMYISKVIRYIQY